MESLLLLGGTTTTDSFAEYFICPQQHKRTALQSDKWAGNERFLRGKKYFKTIVSKIADKVPSQALESNWYGLLRVPRRPQLCPDMEEIFKKEKTEEEFNTVIVIASNNTTPSPAGLTFNMIKKWPEEAKKTNFTAFCNLWSTMEVPTHWK